MISTLQEVCDLYHYRRLSNCSGLLVAYGGRHFITRVVRAGTQFVVHYMYTRAHSMSNKHRVSENI